MKCCSRSTLGVVIGILNILAYIICTICALIGLVQINSIEGTNFEQRQSISTYNAVFAVVIVLCIIMTIISGLLVAGILKKRHKYMLPWLILSGIGFVVNCCRLIYSIVVVIIYGYPAGTILLIVFLGILGIAISALILWPIYTLYRDMRKNNIERPMQMGNNQTIPNYYKTQN